jgi:hypothetical protein
MTFEDAVKIKSTLSAPIRDGVTPIIMVLPDKQVDKTKYLSDFYMMERVDESAKRYCSNQEYCVCAIYTRGYRMYISVTLLR